MSRCLNQGSARSSRSWLLILYKESTSEHEGHSLMTMLWNNLHADHVKFADHLSRLLFLEARLPLVGLLSVLELLRQSSA